MALTMVELILPKPGKLSLTAIVSFKKRVTKQQDEFCCFATFLIIYFFDAGFCMARTSFISVILSRKNIMPTKAPPTINSQRPWVTPQYMVYRLIKMPIVYSTFNRSLKAILINAYSRINFLLPGKYTAL